MAYPGKREGLAQKVDTAAQEAERLGLTTATLILRMARLEIDRAEPEKVETMPRNNLRSKPSPNFHQSTALQAFCVRIAGPE